MIKSRLLIVDGSYFASYRGGYISGVNKKYDYFNYTKYRCYWPWSPCLLCIVIAYWL